MRYLRMSFFTSMSKPPMTTIVAERDFKVPFEQAIEQQVISAAKDGGFTTHEVFEDSDDMIHAGIRGKQLIDEATEHNMAILFFWIVGHMRFMREGGVIAPNPSAPNYPAPLTGEQARSVMEQIVHNPATKPSVTVYTDCEDGTKLELVQGQVTEREDS